MTTLTTRPWLPPVLVGAGTIALVASVVGLASVVGWLPMEWSAHANLLSKPPAPALQARAIVLPAELGASYSSCATCGVVEAVRTVQLKAPAGDRVHPAPVSYRVTIRMDDGSYRTLAQAEPPALSVGDGVQILEGAIVARR